MSTGRISDELLVSSANSRSGPGLAWRRSVQGLNLTLAALRARIALLALASCAALLFRAIDLTQWKRVLIISGGVAGIAIGITALIGLSRHVAFPRGHSGRWLAFLTFGVIGLVVIFDAMAVLRGLGVLDGLPIHLPLVSPDSDPATSLIAAGEVIWLAALVPFSASHARLASSIGASDLSRRSWRAAALVLAAGLAPIAIEWSVVALNPAFPVRAAMVAVAFLLGLIGIAKVVGATRFLASYLKEMLDPRSSALELSAWRRA